MAMKISPMEQVTINALDSGNPFSTPIQKPMRLDGKPVKSTKPEPDPEPIPPKVETVVEVVSEPQTAFVDDDLIPLDNPIIESRSPEGLPSYRCEFAGRDIFVGLPWYKTTNPVTSFVVTSFALDFGRDKIRFDLVMGDAMVYHSRNKIAKAFLETDAKWLFMMDDDIIPSIGRPAWYKNWVASARTVSDVPLQRHVLHRLIGSGKTLIGGAYFGRQEGGRIMCSDLSLENDARAYTDKIAPVDWVGTGAMLVHRKVFDDIQKKYPELKSDDPSMPFDWFRPMGHSKGEDVSFCLRAKAAGHQPHIDLGIPIKHVGYKTY